MHAARKDEWTKPNRKKTPNARIYVNAVLHRLSTALNIDEFRSMANSVKRIAKDFSILLSPCPCQCTLCVCFISFSSFFSQFIFVDFIFIDCSMKSNKIIEYWNSSDFFLFCCWWREKKCAGNHISVATVTQTVRISFHHFEKQFTLWQLNHMYISFDNFNETKRKCGFISKIKINKMEHIARPFRRTSRKYRFALEITSFSVGLV